MNYRNLSDRELVTLAEGTGQAHCNPLLAELVYRVARGCGHPAGADATESLQAKTGGRMGSDKGPRTGLLFNSGVLQD